MRLGGRLSDRSLQWKEAAATMTVTLHSQSWLDSVTSGPAGSVAITVLLLAGACTGLKALARFAYGIYVYFIRPGKNLVRLGQWAAITGATDGIGKAYAFALAKKGVRKLRIRNA